MLVLRLVLQFPKKLPSKSPKTIVVYNPHCRLMHIPRGTPANIRIYLIFLETRIIGLHFAAEYGSSFIGLVKRILTARVLFRRSRSSKFIGFVTNFKRVCDFLLVRHSNYLGPILHRFRDIADLLHPTSIPAWYSRWTKSPMLGSIRAGTLSCSAVKLFPKYSSLCDHGT